MRLGHLLQLRTLTVVAVTVMLTLLVTSVLAQQDPPGQGIDAQPEATTLRGSFIDQVVKVRETNAQINTTVVAPNWANLPGATATINIPAGARGIIEARFSAESACYRNPSTSGATGYCSMRILVNGVEMQPAVGTDFAFNSTNGGVEGSASWESLAMERSSSEVLPAGNYTVQVQWTNTTAGLAHRLDDWHMTVDKVRVP